MTEDGVQASSSTGPGCQNNSHSNNKTQPHSTNDGATGPLVYDQSISHVVPDVVETSDLYSVHNGACQVTLAQISQDASEEKTNKNNDCQIRSGDKPLEVGVSGVVTRSMKIHCFIMRHDNGEQLFGHHKAIAEVNVKKHFDVGDILLFDVKGYVAVNILIGTPSHLWKYLNFDLKLFWFINQIRVL